MDLLKYIETLRFPRCIPKNYQRVDMNNSVSDGFKEFEEANKKLLRLNGVNTNKIRFIPLPTFRYDIDNDVVNPQYTVFFPLRNDGSELFDGDAPVIELDKPNLITTVSVNSYKFEDNYENIAELVKNSKKGIVIFICENHEVMSLNGIPSQYGFSVEDEVIRLRDLDEIEVNVEETQ